MNNYEYIVASLPVISSGFRGELDYEGVLSDISEQLSNKDRGELKLLLDGFNSETLNEQLYTKAFKSKNKFIREYFLFDLCLRNCKVRFLNKNLGRAEDKDVLNILPEEFEFEEQNTVEQALALTDILERERAIDDLLWDKIDSIVGLQIFNADVIFGFVAKLQIVARWLKLDPQTGRELFKQLVDQIRNNKKDIE